MIRGSGFSRSPQHNLFLSERVKEGHLQPPALLPGAIRSGLRRIAQRHRPGLHLDIDLGVDVGGLKADMARPGPDRVDVDLGLKQAAGAGMPNLVRRYGPPCEREHAGGAALHEAVDAEARVGPMIPAQEDGVVGGASRVASRKTLLSMDPLPSVTGAPPRRQGQDSCA